MKEGIPTGYTLFHCLPVRLPPLFSARPPCDAPALARFLPPLGTGPRPAGLNPGECQQFITTKAALALEKVPAGLYVLHVGTAQKEQASYPVLAE